MSAVRRGLSACAELDELAVDWTDFEAAGLHTRAFLRRLANDASALRELVRAVERDDALLAKSERGELLDSVVLYDALERGVRVALHFSTDLRVDRPHGHRYSFSALILRGEYLHTWYRPHGPGAGVVPWLTRPETSGSAYSMHRTAVHTTHTAPGTIALVLRGPAQPRAAEEEERREAPAPRARAPMDRAHYALLRRRAEDAGVIGV